MKYKVGDVIVYFYYEGNKWEGKRNKFSIIKSINEYNCITINRDSFSVNHIISLATPLAKELYGI